MGRTAYGASDAQARRTLGHVVVGQHADRAGHAGAEELVAGRGEDPEGAWPNEGFEFEESKALSSDEKMFVGLPLDDENQLEIADDYIDQWCDQIICEFGLV